MTTAEPKNGVVETLVATIESISRRLENHWTDIEAIIKRLDALERVQRDAEPPTTSLYRNILERAETAERERDEARDEAGVANEYVRGLVDSHKRVETERDEAVEARKVWMEACHTAQAERDALREALRKYGRHLPTCPHVADHPRGWTRCDCGLAAALASATPAEGGEG